MPKLKRTGYAVLKFVHIVSNALWLGGALGMIFLLTLGLQSTNTYAITTAIQILDLGVVVPSASISLITGIIFSSMTHWGFMKHRWIIAKYVINLVPVLLGALVQAPWLVNMLELAKSMLPGSGLSPEFLSLRNQFLIFTIIQWILLVMAVYLSIFKPSLKSKV
jgi:uncharacterized membrane protein